MFQPGDSLHLLPRPRSHQFEEGWKSSGSWTLEHRGIYKVLPNIAHLPLLQFKSVFVLTPESLRAFIHVLWGLEGECFN